MWISYFRVGRRDEGPHDVAVRPFVAVTAQVAPATRGSGYGWTVVLSIALTAHESTAASVVVSVFIHP